MVFFCSRVEMALRSNQYRSMTNPERLHSSIELGYILRNNPENPHLADSSRNNFDQIVNENVVPMLSTLSSKTIIFPYLCKKLATSAR